MDSLGFLSSSVLYKCFICFSARQGGGGGGEENELPGRARVAGAVMAQVRGWAESK